MFFYLEKYDNIFKVDFNFQFYKAWKCKKKCFCGQFHQNLKKVFEAKTDDFFLKQFQ